MVGNNRYMLFSEAKKEKIVLSVLEGNISVSEASKNNSTARKTIYAWIKRYKKGSLAPLYAKGRKHPGATYPKAYSYINRWVVGHPEWGCRTLSKRLKEKGISLSYVQVNKLLNQIGAETYDRRVNYARNFAGPGRNREDVRLEIVKKAITENVSISSLSENYKVARKTIYKWLARYRAVGNIKDSYVVGEAHPRAIYPKITQQVLDLVATNPGYSVHTLAKAFPASSWTIWSILNRNSLNTYSLRLAYSRNISEAAEEKVSTTGISGRIRSVFESFTPNLAPAPPPGKPKNFNLFLVSFLLLSVSLAFFYWMSIIVGASGFAASTGMVFAGVALTLGMFFFLYSLKYFISMAIVLSYSQREGLDSSKVTATGLKSDLANIQLQRHPFVSVHLALYNEKNVVERLAKAVTSFDYEKYEVIFADDSTDQTTDIIREYQKTFLSKGESLKETKGDGWTMTEVEVRNGVIFKHIHRTARTGYKGGALGLALKLTNPKAEFVTIFDADFVPYPDSLVLFLKYFKLQNDGSEDYLKSNTASVQGYQWHVLNKSENWITRGVRSEYAGSYVIERAGTEIYRGLKQISGSVYMIRRDVLDSIGWGISITEDFELTLKLYNAGYKVVYTPYIQAPAECVSTLRRLVRQRMRWAEGHSFNIKRMFAKLMLSPKLSPAEKFETVYLAPYYLQALFFLVGTLSWLISETIFKVRLPFWTELWGWSLVLTNMISLPLLNSVGLFLEESDQKDYLGISSFIALSYIVVPFQAYAAVKGFLEKEEGPWFRTPKTGRITDVFKRGKFYKFISDILPARIAAQSVASGSGSPYLALTTANNRFDNFTIKPRNARWIGKTVAVVVIILSLLINSMGFYVKPALAAGWYDNNWADRQRVTVNASKVGGSLTNYPVYVNLADLGNSVHYLESSQSDFSSGTLTNVTATVSGQLQLDPSGGSVDDGSSLSSWTNSGATVDNTNGNPLPSFKATGGHYAYKNVNITSNEILEFDVYVIPGSVDLCNFYFMTDSSGQGQMFRFESRSGNSSGFASTTSWGSWNAPSGQGVISAGVWHHARLVFGSTSVSGYVDGTSYGSYTFANKGGYIAVHGDGGSVTGGEFDNITINNGFVSSGNRVSNTVDLSGAQTVASSTISWTTITPANTTVSLSSRISTDGGNNWSAYQTDTSGSSIPGLTTNMNLSNVKLQLQEDLSTTDIMATPLLQSVTVLVTGSGGFFSNVKSDGSDIVVTASDGTTKLSRELVSINTTNSTGELYFNAPSLSNSSNTDFYVYYGNSSGSETNSTATWDSNYQGVWHFNEDTGTNTADSTSNGNVGTLTNSPSWTTGGNPYNAISYSGGTDYTNTNYVQNSVTAYTISAWIKTTDAGAEKTIVQDRGSGAGLSLTLGIGATGGQHGGPGDVGFEVDSNSIDIGVSSTKAVNDNIWHQVVGVWSAPASTAVAASQFTIYIDGQAATTTTGTAGSTTSPLTGSGGTKIARHDAWTTNLNATLDEIRISTSTRTAAWILTDYNNTSNTTTFYTVAASETVPEFSLPLLPLAIVIPLFVSYIIKKDKKERRLVYE